MPGKQKEYMEAEFLGCGRNIECEVLLHSRVTCDSLRMDVGPMYQDAEYLEEVLSVPNGDISYLPTFPKWGEPSEE